MYDKVWFLSQCRATKVQASPRKSTDLQEPSLLTCTKFGCRGSGILKFRPLAPLDTSTFAHMRYVLNTMRWLVVNGRAE